MKLTDRAIATLAHDAGRRIVWDETQRGFGIRVEPPSARVPAGRKTYLVRYKDGDGKVREMALGSPSEMSVAQARKRAGEVRAGARFGMDPLRERRERAAESATVAELCERFLSDPTLGHKPRTRVDMRATIANHVLPTAGARRLSSLTTADVRRLQSDVAAGKTASSRKTKARGVSRVRGGLTTSGKVVRYLSSIFSYGVERGLLPANPATGVKKPQTRQRTRVYSADELDRIADALAALEGNVSAAAHVQIDALRLVMLTGMRAGEVLSLAWEDVDPSAGVLRLPDAKAGARTVPLAPAAVVFLGALPRRDERWVFPASRGGGPLGSVRDVWRKVVERAGLTGEGLNAPVVHSFRHSIVTSAIAAGVPGPVVMKLAGHRHVSMLARYSHVEAGSDPARQAAALASASAARALARSLGAKEGGEVVKMPKRGAAS